jgi:hypothetical protein
MQRLAAMLTLLALGAGSNAYRLQPPPGFAEVVRGPDGAQMIAGDKVGLNVKVYDNVRGGTLSFWGTELVRKLADRGYVLRKQSAVESKNGVNGTRFDFAYTNPDGDNKFYSVVLFATNKHRVVVQVAGDEEHAARYHGHLDAIARDTVARGCRVGEKICRSPQPPLLSTPEAPPRPPNADASAAARADGDAQPSDG